ncbi:SpoIID/LytB domain-containing protein [bacterium]|nr:SpoIID/LytB domain-containing protein [bacterium]
MKRLALSFAVFLTMSIFANPCYAIKIGLQTDVESVGIGASAETTLVDANTHKTVMTFDAMKGYEIIPYKNTMAIALDGKFYQIYSDNVILKCPPGGFVSAKGKWYRGLIIVQNKNKKLTVINDVELEDYIRGVVPAEMPPSWELEALKAQAMAARSYALANLGKRAVNGYDLKDTPEDQAYGGASVETEKTNKAVQSTLGLVLTYNMKVVPAYYTASAGGKTLNASSAWGSDLPFIRSVPSYDDEVKKKGHGVGMSQHGANNLAKQGYNAFQILDYFYQNIKFAKVSEYSASQ